MDLGLSERAAPLVTAMGAALGLKGAPPAPTGRRRAIPGRAIGQPSRNGVPPGDAVPVERTAYMREVEPAAPSAEPKLTSPPEPLPP